MYIHRFIILRDIFYYEFLSIKIDDDIVDVICANLGAGPPQPNHDRFRPSGGGNGTSAAAMISRSLFRRVGSMDDTVAVMSMPYLLGVVGGETREGAFTDAPSCSRLMLQSSTAIRRP